jgi:2-dehydro-3-deoxyphosphogluconate aldolase/(4S)-4-hydroxy-2-oxoglutarate aldolase
MHRSEIFEKILETGVVSIIRMKTSNHIMKVLESLQAGGINTWEITLNTPNALQSIETIASENGSSMIGAGTVLDVAMAKRAINAGAKFLVTPVVNPDIIVAAHQHEVPVFMGAFSPTEIFTAHQYGADMVKLFPAGIHGLSYFRALQGPLQGIKLMPTGGVTPDNAGEWIHAGAHAVGIGSSLIQPEAVQSGNFSRITDLSKRLVENILSARSALK